MIGPKRDLIAGLMTGPSETSPSNLPLPWARSLHATDHASNAIASATRFVDATAMQEGLVCPNCDTQAPDSFCPNCGQKQTGRLSMRLLGSEFAARFFSAERGIWRTLVELTVRPGRTARHYIDGRRQRYISPLFWYALCAAAQLIGIWILREQVSAMFVGNLPPQYLAFLESKGVSEPERWAADRYHTLIQSAYSWLGLLTFVLPTAIVLRLLIGARINFAEALVVSLYTIGHVMLITAVTGQVMIRTNIIWHGYISYGLYFSYAVLTVGGCCGWKWRPLLAGALAIVIGGLCFFGTLIKLTMVVLTTGF